MRHLGSILLAVVAAPLALLLAGRGLVGLPEAAEASRTDYFAFAAAGSALGLAGLLYAALTMVRLSPLGPALAGAGYLAVGSWALADPDGLHDAVRWDLVWLTEAQVDTAAMIAPLLSVPLLLTLFLPQWWRRRYRDGPDAQAWDADPRPGGGLPTHTLDDIPRVPAPPPPAPPLPTPPPRYQPPPDPDATPHLGLR